MNCDILEMKLVLTANLLYIIYIRVNVFVCVWWIIKTIIMRIHKYACGVWTILKYSKHHPPYGRLFQIIDYIVISLYNCSALNSQYMRSKGLRQKYTSMHMLSVYTRAIDSGCFEIVFNIRVELILISTCDTHKANTNEHIINMNM